MRKFTHEDNVPVARLWIEMIEAGEDVLSPECVKKRFSLRKRNRHLYVTFYVFYGVILTDSFDTGVCKEPNIFHGVPSWAGVLYMILRSIK